MPLSHLIESEAVESSNSQLDEAIFYSGDPLNDLERPSTKSDSHVAKAKQFVKFGMVGCSGMVVDFGAFLLMSLVFSMSISRGVAIWIAMSWNFALNRKVTFTERKDQSILREYLGFCLSCLVGAIANWGTFMVLCSTSSFFEQYPLLVAGLGVVAGTVFNFVLCSNFVFRNDGVETLETDDSKLTSMSGDSDVFASESHSVTQETSLSQSRAA